MIYSSRALADTLTIGCTADAGGAVKNFVTDTLTATGTNNDTTGVLPTGCTGLWVQLISQGTVTDGVDLKLLLDDSTTITVATIGASTIDQGTTLTRLWIPLNVQATTTNYPKFRIQGATGATGTNVVQVIAVNATAFG